MPKRADPSSPHKDSYRRQTLRPLNNLIFLAPLLLFFHAVSAIYGTGSLVPLVPMYLRDVLSYFGATADILLPLLIVAVLLGQHLAHREAWTVQPKAVAGMLAESIGWTIPLIAVSFLTGKLASGQLGLSPHAQGVLREILRAFGAGIYEEFLFRLVLISLIMALFVDLLNLRKDAVTVVAVIAAGAFFSLCHFSIGPFSVPEPFSWNSFVFRTLAGVLWGSLYIFRGLGVAVGSHIVWDLYVLATGASHLAALGQ